jgi:transposase-like protein
MRHGIPSHRLAQRDRKHPMDFAPLPSTRFDVFEMRGPCGKRICLSHHEEMSTVGLSLSHLSHRLSYDHPETDEMFQHAGEKSEKHTDPMDPPRCRANKQRGRGTYDNDRPPSVGTSGRESGHVRLRVVSNTTGETLQAQVHPFTHAQAIVYTDETTGYHHIIRVHATVNQACMIMRAMTLAMECAKCMATRRKACGRMSAIFCARGKGVHKKHLAGYVAMCEFRRNLKRVSPAFLSSLVTFHTFCM